MHLSYLKLKISTALKKILPSRFHSNYAIGFEKTIRVLRDLCTLSSKVSKYCFLFWIGSNISWNKKVIGLFLFWYINSFSINLSVLTATTYKDNTLKPNGEWVFIHIVILYIKREITDKIESNSIIDEFFLRITGQLW